MKAPAQAKAPCVLIIDDDVPFSEALSNQLTSVGYRVLLAHTGCEAMRMLGNQRFACVLVDLKLGSAHGGDIICQVRSNTGSMNVYTPMLVISGFLERNSIVNLRDSVAGFIVKPFPAEAIAKRIGELANSPPESRGIFAKPHLKQWRRA